VNTICFPTKRNQEELKKMAQENDVVIIIGSYTSANTKRLTTLAKKINPRSFQVEDASGVDTSWFEGVESVGITAGASTPDYLIEEVVRRIERINNEEVKQEV
jgi:4-hydroxy-3-methylbut-2-enyl diphosphate reductase